MMKQTDNRVAQLEEEVRVLQAQLEQMQKSECHLWKSECTFRGIFNHSADGIALMDSNGILREWSSGYEKISGLTKEAVVGKMRIWEVAEILYPFEEHSREECERMKAELKALVAAMPHKTLVHHVKHSKTGELRIFNILFFPVAMTASETMFCSISRDITEEIRSRELLELNERKLIAEKKRLVTLSDNLPDGILYRLVLERDTGKKYMEFVSGTWERITGLTPEAIAEDVTPFDNIVHPEDWPRMNHLNELTTNNLSDFNIDVRINKKGELRWLRISSKPYADGNKVIWDGIMTDITSRKHAEIELVRAKEKAEESDRLKSAFLANVSHEIRTPLNGITGFLHFLSSDRISPELRQEYINVVNNSSAQLVKLIDDIVDLAKIEAKQLNMHPVPLCINSLMTEMRMFFETYLQSTNKEHIALIYDERESKDNCVALVDPLRLRQVLNNLISNAIKFTDKGYIRFGYRQSAPEQLEFFVEDTGIGINPEQHEIIYERFRQVELTNNRVYGGTGIGLNIARSIVQMMGGDIRLESSEGNGAKFFFTISYLPVAKED